MIFRHSKKKNVNVHQGWNREVSQVQNVIKNKGRFSSYNKSYHMDVTQIRYVRVRSKLECVEDWVMAERPRERL